jgi:hypothetical protein
MKPTSEILIEARKKVESESNWARDYPSLKQGIDKHCCLTAITFTASGVERDTAVSAFRLAIDNPIIQDWNDAPGRTHAEVLAAFDRAIEVAKEQERIANTLVAARHLGQRTSTEGSNRHEQCE